GGGLGIRLVLDRLEVRQRFLVGLFLGLRHRVVLALGLSIGFEYHVRRGLLSFHIFRGLVDLVGGLLVGVSFGLGSDLCRLGLLARTPAALGCVLGLRRLL